MIALLGQCVEDVVRVAGAPPQTRLGGAPLFAAEAVSRAHGEARIGTRGGTPALRAPLLEVGLPVVVGPAHGTFQSLLDLHTDGTREHVIGALGDPFTPADLEGWLAPVLDGTTAVVCGAQWRDDFGAETLAALRRGGRRVYLDGQGPARPGLGPVVPTGPLDPRLAAQVDVLKLDDAEALALLGGTDAAAAARCGVPVVLVTHGPTGSTVLVDGQAHPVIADTVELADAVGSGDAFLALYAVHESRGHGPVEAARAAGDGVAAWLRERLPA